MNDSTKRLTRAAAVQMFAAAFIIPAEQDVDVLDEDLQAIVDDESVGVSLAVDTLRQRIGGLPNLRSYVNTLRAGKQKRSRSAFPVGLQMDNQMIVGPMGTLYADLEHANPMFAQRLLARSNLFDALVSTLQVAIDAAPPIPKPLGADGTELVNDYAPWVAVAKALVEEAKRNG